MRIAYLSPLPPDPSGVADYSAELLPWLRRECEVDAYTAAAHAAAVDAGALGVTVRPYEAFAALADRYDALLAHFSCEQAAVGPYEVFERFGGIAVLHDLNLSGLFGARVFSSRPGYYFFPELWRQEGAGAALKAATRFLLTRQFPGTHDYWMSRGVIRRSRAVIVHSHWSRDWVAAAQGGRSQAFAVTMGVPLPERPTPAAQAAARAALGLSPTAFVIGSFGVVDESKRFTPILRAFAAVASRLPEARYVFVGRCQDQHLRQVADMGLTDRVHMVGRVDEHRFYEYMTAADVYLPLEPQVAP